MDADEHKVITTHGKGKRKKSRKWVSLILLGLGLVLIVKPAGGLVSGGLDFVKKWGFHEPVFEKREYTLTDEGRDDFKIDIDGSVIPGHGNGQRYIAIHFLGVVGENHSIEENGVGTHFYIYYDGTIYQAADLDAVTWQVGTGGGYEQIHPEACNANTIGIELCVMCDGDEEDSHSGEWYFTEETQRAAVRLVRCLMRELDIPLENVLRHGDIVNKWCPAPYLDNNSYKGSWTWDEFKAAVAALAEEAVPDYPIVAAPEGE